MNRPGNPIKHIENTFIELSDGTKLAARIWMPEDADVNPVPAILEYLPYRKRDSTRTRDALTHPYFAAHGYASIRVDMRGSGDSDGVMVDEYLPQEQDDALEVLKWLAEQPWCTGKVGMIGISWGGFNGLQIAALRPDELKAVITICSTDDRYADDVHYMGGALLGDNLSWASTMFAYNSRPPDPQLVGERWREMWLERLEGSGLWIEKWLKHQHRDAYWKHGSINEDYSAITCPVMAVGGWADGYTSAIFRMLENLEVPRQGLVGPWAHLYPHMAVPGPAIGFLQEALRWWDKWLKGIDNDVMDEPMLRAWVQDSAPPASQYEERPGRWVGEPSWPSPHISQTSFSLSEGRIDGRGERANGARVQTGERAPDAEPLTIRSPFSVGLNAGKWCAFGTMPDLPGEQREEDSGSLVFDSAPLEEDVEILGAPVVELELAVDKPIAMVAARLCDVLPDGRVTRVTYGLLNLTQRNSREHPEPLEPGRRYRVRLQLNDVGQQFPKGHRVRLSLSTSYWPLAWLPPEPVTMTVYPSSSSLLLPLRPAPRREDQELSVVSEVESAPPLKKTVLVAPDIQATTSRNLGTGEAVYELERNEGSYRIDEIDLEVAIHARERYSVHEADIGSARGEASWEYGLSRGDWETKTITKTVLTSTPTHFRVRATLDAYEGETRVFCKTWDEEIPRDLL